MPRSPITLSVLTAVLLLVTPARAEDMRAVIEAANTKFMSDYAAGDTKTIAMSYAEDGVMLPPDATRVAGRAAIEALWKSWIDDGLTDLTLETTDFKQSGDLAYEIGNFTIKVPVEGADPITATGNYVVVWERGGDGVWRLKIDTWNDTPPPAEAEPTSGG